MPSNAALDPAPRLLHDIAETINVIRGSLDLLHQRHSQALPEQGKELLRIALQSAHGARDLVQAARVTPRSARNVPLTSFDPSPMLRQVTDAVKAHHPGASIDVQAVPRVHANEMDLRRIFQNLLANAAGHGGTRPMIRVIADAEHGEIHFQVIDDGPGIDPRDHLSLFRHAATADGHGEGLPIALDLVQVLGGKMWIQSEPSGTTMHFTLPAGDR